MQARGYPAYRVYRLDRLCGSDLNCIIPSDATNHQQQQAAGAVTSLTQMASNNTTTSSTTYGTTPSLPPNRHKKADNPVSTWVPAKAHEDPILAYEVPRARRILQVLVAVIYSFLAAGVVFGYAALKPVLVEEGVYRDRCPPEELELWKDVGTCDAQEMRLNLMFAVAAVASNVSALPVGTILDRYGPRIAALIGGMLVGVGCLTLGLAPRLPFDGYIPGYLFLALGGPFVFMPAFQLSNAFPAHSGLILSLLTGAFDASSAVFLIYRLVYQRTHGGFTPQKFFLLYLAVPVMIILMQLFLMPKKSYKTLGELVREAQEHVDEQADALEDHHHHHTDDEHQQYRHDEAVVSEVTRLLGMKGAAHQTEEEEKKRDISGVWGALHGYSARQQIKSPYFVLVTLFTIVQMTRINYFVATVRTQYAHLLNDQDAAVRINEMFDIALPLGGVLAVPFIGIVLDKTSTSFVLALLVALATIIGVLGVLPYLWAAHFTVCLFVVYRPFFYTALSDYAAKVFGFRTFGKVFGLVMCISGLFNFSQYGLDALTHRFFHADPVPVDVALLILGLVTGSVLVGYVVRQSHVLKRSLLEREAEEATEVRLPGAAAGNIPRSRQ